MRVREDFKLSFRKYGLFMIEPSPAYRRLSHYPGLLRFHFELPQQRTQCIKKSGRPPWASPSSHTSVTIANDLSRVTVWREMAILATSFEDGRYLFLLQKVPGLTLHVLEAKATGYIPELSSLEPMSTLKGCCGALNSAVATAQAR